MGKIKILLGASALLFSSVSHATIIYDDGLVHIIDSVVLDDIVLQNRSGLNIVQGGLIASPTNPAILAGDLNVNMTGNATVLGGMYGWSSGGTVSMSDNSLVSGGVSEMRNFEIRDNATILGGLENSNSGVLFATISGGQIIGSDNLRCRFLCRPGDVGGDAINGVIDRTVVSMSAGLLLGGYGSETGGNGVGYGSWFYGDFSGGSVIGGNGGVSGGHGIFSREIGSLSITGGTFIGGNGSMYGGDALNLRSDGIADPYNISGGEFNVGTGSVDDGWLLNLQGSRTNAEITGGMFGYENAGNGIEVSRGATLDIYGWNLQIEDNWLTGYLGDGNWIQTYVSLSPDSFSPGNLNLHQVATNPVPEPPEILLFATGILGLFFARRKLKAGTSPVTS